MKCLMKKISALLIFLLSQISFAQTNIDQLLETGVENATRFAQGYFEAGGEALIVALSNSWYNTAETKEKFHFEVNIVGNFSSIREEKRSFIFNELDYEGISFVEAGPVNRNVSSVFGNNADTTLVFVETEDGGFEFKLPDGIGEDVVKMIPTAFVQVGFGLSESTELKVRFLPKISLGRNTEVSLYGVGFQHELSESIFALKRFPLRLAAIVGFTRAKGIYDFSEDSVIQGVDQDLQIRTNSFFISPIFSTKFPKLNFYGGLGLYSGKSVTELAGRYQLENGPLAGQTVIDPVEVTHKETALKATAGAKISLGLFRFNLDYTLQNYNNLSLGINVGW